MENLLDYYDQQISIVKTRLMELRRDRHKELTKIYSKDHYVPERKRYYYLTQKRKTKGLSEMEIEELTNFENKYKK